MYLLKQLLLTSLHGFWNIVGQSLNDIIAFIVKILYFLQVRYLTWSFVKYFFILIQILVSLPFVKNIDVGEKLTIYYRW